MAEAAPSACIVLTTTASQEEASLLASALIEERLAACVTLVPGVLSVYRWQGQIESSTETLVLVKTCSSQLAALEARLHTLHGYQTPEFLVFKADAASQPYLDWLQASLRQP